MTTLCLHHNDSDGRASAAIVRRALGSNAHFYEIDYGDPVPWDQAAAASTIVMVDFSLSLPEMERLSQGRQLIWIDHHVSAIQELSGEASSWGGVRDTRDAACVLTWHYFFPDKPVPKGIVLIGDRDTWRWAEADTGPFDEGLFQQDTDPTNDDFWIPLLNDDPQVVIELVSQGRILREARLRAIRRDVDHYGYAVTFEGYSAMAINKRGSGDMGEYMRKQGYQIAYCYIDNCQNGNLRTFVSLYSSEVDVSSLARKFGGGGHRGAAGFSFERNATPFPPEAEVSL